MPPEIEEADLMLARAAKNAFARAEHMQALCLAAETVAEAAEASRACDRAERSMRQHLLMLERQQRARRAEARETEDVALRRRERRAHALRGAMRRVICAERAEAAERLELLDALEDLIDPETGPRDMADRPFQAQLLEIADTLGLSRETTAGWVDLPCADAPFEGELDEESGDISHLPEDERRRILMRHGVVFNSS